VRAHVGVLGGGAWGTALAACAALAGGKVTIQAREAEVVASINKDRVNSLFLPGQTLPEAVSATDDVAGLAGCDIILAVPPAQHMRACLKALKPVLKDATPVVLCSKGIERDTLQLMTDVLVEELPQAVAAVLSGPSFARDVVIGLPTAVTLACRDETAGSRIVAMLAGRTFRPYLSDDLIGAEVGGAVKNVLAIACGLAEGRGLGESARSALITRGFAEMTRLGVTMGARAQTLAGLCGLGDLVLTCSSTTSRNFSLGVALGKGLSLEEALAGKLSVAEGAQTAPALIRLAAREGVEMPISAAVQRILAGEIDVAAAIETLMTRPLKQEF
jgi:glycerol-3-phosphate dehydrogenase (NAD(P)+)